MKIEWTEKAKQKMTEILNGQDGYMKLKYDTEGCGCVMSGVTALWLVRETEADDELVDTNLMPVYIERTKAVFLDEIMKIDFVPEVNSFQLKSPNGMLNPRLSYHNKMV
ncbi:iron-sulfur cluster biosynthesis family protein [Peribacillus loiseleuriae]|uniref:iron-sulfur cluster biosynthesis family protein n=1 Tax=Peribacillus loiseleuriae TaxID=1679170 RepID=UPI003817BDB7